MNLIKYFRGTRGEIKHITWPSQKQVVVYTTAVIVISVLVAAIIAGLDFGFTKAVQWLIEN